MSESKANGVVHDDDVTNWEIVSSGKTDYIGVPTGEEAGIVRLWPVYEYVTGTQIQQTGSGLNVQRNRFALPIEMLGSGTKVGIWVRWVSRYALRDFNADDRRTIMTCVRQAEDMARSLSAKSAGLVLATDVPRGMPLKPGEKG